MMEPEVIRTFPNGPRRLFSEQRFPGGVPYKDAGHEGFAGLYVCELCQTQAHQLVATRGQWICRWCQTSGQRNRDARSSAMKATRMLR
jgi:hypothetical protein